MTLPHGSQVMESGAGFTTKARSRTRRISNNAHRASHPLLLEWLEDRLVPSITDGTILVASCPLSGAQAPSGIIGVDPNTGAQSLVSTGGLFVQPETVREGQGGQLYVADYSALNTGAIIGVDPNNGKQSLVATGGNINGPLAVAIQGGLLYVADSNGVPNLVEINLSTGQQRLVSSGGSFSTPVGLAAAPNHSLYVADEYAFGGAGAIFSVDLETGVQSLISQGGLFDHLVDLGLDANGNLLAYNAAGSVVRIDAQTHSQSLIISADSLMGIDGDTVDLNHVGAMFVSARPSGELSSRIVAFDPSTGAPRTISSGGNLSLVTGLMVFSKSSPVQFQFDGSDAGNAVSVSTADGATTASTSIPTFAVGSHTVTASYSGDSNFGASSSTAVSQSVNKASTNTAVLSFASPSASGQNLSSSIGTLRGGQAVAADTIEFVASASTAATSSQNRSMLKAPAATTATVSVSSQRPVQDITISGVAILPFLNNAMESGSSGDTGAEPQTIGTPVSPSPGRVLQYMKRFGAELLTSERTVPSAADIDMDEILSLDALDFASGLETLLTGNEEQVVELRLQRESSLVPVAALLPSAKMDLSTRTGDASSDDLILHMSLVGVDPTMSNEQETASGSLRAVRFASGPTDREPQPQQRHSASQPRHFERGSTRGAPNHIDLLIPGPADRDDERGAAGKDLPEQARKTESFSGSRNRSIETRTAGFAVELASLLFSVTILHTLWVDPCSAKNSGKRTRRTPSPLSSSTQEEREE